MDPAVGVEEQESTQRWLLLTDRVLVKAVAAAVGAEGLEGLVAHFERSGEFLTAARIEWAIASLGEAYGRESEAAHGSAAALACRRPPR